jgi:hypothetical protein
MSVLAFAQGFSLPPLKPQVLVPNTCCYTMARPLAAFAFRVHTHALGREVFLERLVVGRGRPMVVHSYHVVSLVTLLSCCQVVCKPLRSYHSYHAYPSYPLYHISLTVTLLSCCQVVTRE